jgi:hypothetical protein
VLDGVARTNDVHRSRNRASASYSSCVTRPHPHAKVARNRLGSCKFRGLRASVTMCPIAEKRTEQYVGITLELRSGPDRAALRIRDGSWPIHSAFHGSRPQRPPANGDQTLARLNIFTAMQSGAIDVTHTDRCPEQLHLPGGGVYSSCCVASSLQHRGRLAVATQPTGLARTVPLRCEGR